VEGQWCAGLRGLCVFREPLLVFTRRGLDLGDVFLNLRGRHHDPDARLDRNVFLKKSCKNFRHLGLEGDGKEEQNGQEFHVSVQRLRRERPQLKPQSQRRTSRVFSENPLKKGLRGERFPP